MYTLFKSCMSIKKIQITKCSIHCIIIIIFFNLTLQFRQNFYCRCLHRYITILIDNNEILGKQSLLSYIIKFAQENISIILYRIPITMFFSINMFYCCTKMQIKFVCFQYLNILQCYLSFVKFNRQFYIINTMHLSTQEYK